MHEELNIHDTSGTDERNNDVFKKMRELHKLINAGLSPIADRLSATYAMLNGALGISRHKNKKECDCKCQVKKKRGKKK